MGFTTASALVNELMEARDEMRLARLKMLIVDELGFRPLSPTGAELLFEVFSQRYERGSILVTTNLPFDEWKEIVRFVEADRSSARQVHSPRPHHRDERRQLPSQAEQQGNRNIVLKSS